MRHLLAADHDDVSASPEAICAKPA